MWGFSNPIGVAEWQIVCSVRVCFKKYIWICLLVYVQINIRTSQIYVYTDIDICKEIGNKNKNITCSSDIFKNVTVFIILIISMKGI